MPELPDVEVFKRYLDVTALHKTIERVEVRSRKILEGVSPERLTQGLEGRTLESTCRHGKYLFVHLHDGNWLALHFGMAGFLKYFKRMEMDSPHDRLLLKFTNGYHLAYDCMRLLGRGSLIESPTGFVTHKGLGPDALDTEGVDSERFKDLLAHRRGMVKSALMNRRFLAGIWNVYKEKIRFRRCLL